jgi:isopentenyl phosphate kinase
MNQELIFLKLGGSLITEKARAETALPEVIQVLLEDLKVWLDANPQSKVLLGHGSGSFGHYAAAKHNTRLGVNTSQEWQGFIEVWQSARKLNQIVLEIGLDLGLNLISFPPSACLLSENRQVKSWNLQPIQAALTHNLIPLVYGDVVFDDILGGTIFSTEELFTHLALNLKPNRILLAGIEEAVYADFPQKQKPIRSIDKDIALESYIQESQNQDVTGGMRSEVSEMQKLCRITPGLKIEIFRAARPGELCSALNGKHSGTIIS